MPKRRPRSSLPRRRLIGVAFLVAAVALAIVLVARSGGRDAAPDSAALERLSQAIDHSALAREGVFVNWIDIVERDGRRCVEVLLLNPTAPNRAWVRERYGPHVCVSREPGTAHFNHDMRCPRGGTPTEVPDVTGMGLGAARRRLHAAGFTLNCNTGLDKPDWRFSPRQALIVERTCAKTAGAGATVMLKLAATLPGGFRWVDDDCDW